MKFSLKAVALGALFASVAVAAPIEVEKRDANSDRIAACFINLIFTGSWPGSCQAAVAVNIGLIKTITINQMSMDFTPANAWAPTTSSNSVVATMLSIPGITLPIDSVRQHIILVDNGVQLGNIDTPWSAASVNGGTLTTSFSSSTLNVFSNAHDAFSKFVSALSTTASHPVTLKGAVDVKLNLGWFGHLTIPGIGFQATTNFQGLNNLQGMKYIFQVNSDFMTMPGAILLSSIIKINNPTNLSLKLGKIVLATASGSGPVGNSTIDSLSLVPGDNLVVSTTALDQSLPAGASFLGDLFGGKDQTLVLTGYDKTSTNAALNAGLAAMKSNLFIPGGLAGLSISQPPYLNWSLKTTPTTNTDLILKATATFQSPYYGFPLQMVSPGPNFSMAQIINVSFQADGATLFNFLDDLTYNVQGSGQVTATFSVLIKNTPFTKDEKPIWQDIVNYGKAHGAIPVNFQFVAQMIFNNNGIVQDFDLSNSALELDPTNVAVGADFESILNAFPSA
ncbi:hypothetical protein EMPS_03340 [Entomortierella parvispora]|uniref:Uncharacterized protein n=1 Tax=Entomortierella parvispora TaxID=205924 RepID=A0A9P3LUS8_9FUNG|nr:hypothetical protein EMPS_03340 [Entomortierella parvispora]